MDCWTFQISALVLTVQVATASEQVFNNILLQQKQTTVDWEITAEKELAHYAATCANLTNGAVLITSLALATTNLAAETCWALQTSLTPSSFPPKCYCKIPLPILRNTSMPVAMVTEPRLKPTASPSTVNSAETNMSARTDSKITKTASMNTDASSMIGVNLKESTQLTVTAMVFHPLTCWTLDLTVASAQLKTTLIPWPRTQLKTLPSVSTRRSTILLGTSLVTSCQPPSLNLWRTPSLSIEHTACRDAAAI